MVDINMISEGKKFPTLTTVQDLFNITDSKQISINIILVVKCPYCSQLVYQLLSSKMIIGNQAEMEQYDYINTVNQGSGE